METKDGRPYEEAEIAYEDMVSSRYNRDYHEAPVMRRHSEDFVKFVADKYRPGDRVLDLGCGPASLWGHWQNALPDIGALVGVDLSPGMIEEARRAYPFGDFRVGSFFKLPAESGAFDLVIVSSALHHIADADLPAALTEIQRVLDEHGALVGREPLSSGRLSDRGGWLAGALMELRHLAYRLTHTREFPEPDPGPAHHAYNADEFLDLLSQTLYPSRIHFRNPISPFLSRVRHGVVAKLAILLDEAIEHREGQEVVYVAQKNYSNAEQVQDCVRKALAENSVRDVDGFLALVEASAKFLERELLSKNEHDNLL